MSARLSDLRGADVGVRGPSSSQLPLKAVPPWCVQTVVGWLSVKRHSTAVMALAEPSIACATGLAGSASAAAICSAVRPASTCGL